jgi:hypothetical protein
VTSSGYIYNGATGIFTIDSQAAIIPTGAAGSAHSMRFVYNLARQVPIANKNEVRSWGALACVYLGLPQS